MSGVPADMRDYALIWNTRIERYEVFDLRDCKRQLKVLGGMSAGEVECKIIERLFENVCRTVGRDAQAETTVKRPAPYTRRPL